MDETETADEQSRDQMLAELHDRLTRWAGTMTSHRLTVQEARRQADRAARWAEQAAAELADVGAALAALADSGHAAELARLPAQPADGVKLTPRREDDE